MNKLRWLPPPVVAVLTLGLASLLNLGLAELPRLRLPGLGLLLMATGILLALSALLQFWRHRTTPLPHGESAALVTAGPYLWTRNPMYLGLFTALMGFALYTGPLPLFLAPIAFALIIDRVHIPYEEATLARLFGETYRDYRNRVARWL